MVCYDKGSTKNIMASNFRTVGCDSNLAAIIEEEFSDFFPVRTCNVSAVSEIERSNESVDSTDCIHDNDDDIESDDEDISLDVISSPIVQGRIRQFLNNTSADSDDDDEPAADLHDMQQHEDGEENISDRNTFRQIEEQCRKECLHEYTFSELQEHRLNVLGMDKESRDMLIIGQLQACGVSKGSETRAGTRKRHKFDYQHNNQSVCISCFLFVNNINIHYLKNVREHFLKNGAVPRIHGNSSRTPKHAVTYENVNHIVQFLTRLADELGLPQAAAPRGRDGFAPIYLPGRETYKSIHKKYEEVSRETEARVLSETTFRRVWQKCLPHIQFMTHRTDVCHKCEQYREQIQKALTEDEKLAASQKLSDHTLSAQQERTVYKERCHAAALELEGHPLSTEPVPPASQNLHHAHYTFDFAQSVLLPSHCRQEGVLYFRSLYKVNLFGICNDGRSLQTNYIFGEEQCMGKDGLHSHSANSVVSMLHHYFASHGEGERTCFLNADNCGGQNKNQIITSYLAWRVGNGLHDDIHLHFMKPYHARCLVDGMFGIAKRRIRRSDCDSLIDMKECIQLSSPCNKVELYSELSENSWQWRNWKSFFKETFRAVPGIQLYQHFHFSSSSPGKVTVKKSSDGEPVLVRLLKKNKEMPHDVPEVVPPAGLSDKRAWYLYKNIRPFVREQQKDLICPLPQVEEPLNDRVTEE